MDGWDEQFVILFDCPACLFFSASWLLSVTGNVFWARNHRKCGNANALIFGVSIHAFHHYISTLIWCSFPVQVSPARWMLHGLEVFADVIPVRSWLCACVRHIQCPERTAVARSHINISRARTLCGFQLMLVNRRNQAQNSIALSSLLKRAKSSLKWHWQVKSRGTAN